MVCSFCKVDISELRENGRRVQVKHKLSLGAHVDGEWKAGGNKTVGEEGTK